jgi:uncharacterized protein (TIGR02231 family)
MCSLTIWDNLGRKARRGFTDGFAFALLAVPGVNGFAADLTADAHIDRVTVYRQGAAVTRVAQIAVPAGSHRLIFRGLPADADEKTLEVSLDNAAIQLGGIEVVRINAANFVSEPESELRRKIEESADQQTVLKDEIATAQNQLKLLDSLASNPAGSPTKATVDAANLGAVLATMSASESAARKRIREANLQLRAVERQLVKLKADLAKVATASKQSTEVRASILAASAVTAGVSVSYKISNAGWDWIYQARLDTAKKHLVLDRQGSVTQGSGEDWNNVELTLTTATPSNDLGTPGVSSLFVDLRSLEPPRLLRNRVNALDMPTAPAPALVGGAELQEVVVTGTRRQSADAASTDYVADYHVPSRVSLPADRQSRLFPIGQNSLDVSLVARVVPSVDHMAHLEAVFKYSDPLPIEAGQLELYGDGAYVGEAGTQAFLPGADVRMPFGVDGRIRVTIRDEATQSGQKGFLGRQASKEMRQRIDITNYHPTTIQVEVLDRVPVSKSADIHVDILKGATDPTVKDFEDKAGVWLWKLEPASQQTVTIHQAFAIQYPAGRELQEATGSDAQ